MLDPTQSVGHFIQLAVDLRARAHCPRLSVRSGRNLFSSCLDCCHSVRLSRQIKVPASTLEYTNGRWDGAVVVHQTPSVIRILRARNADDATNFGLSLSPCPIQLAFAFSCQLRDATLRTSASRLGPRHASYVHAPSDANRQRNRA